MKFDLIEQDSPVLDLAKEDQTVAKMLNENTFKPRMDIATVEEPPTQQEVAVFKQQFENLPAVRNLTNEIDINDPSTIHAFGNKAGEVIERVADNMMQNTKAIQTKEVTEMMVSLSKIMKQFNTRDFDVDALAGKKGFLSKWKEKTRCAYEDVIAKYDNLAKNVDSIAKQLKGYERDIDSANVMLNQLYEANKQAYQQLEMYVVACGIGLKEIDDQKTKVEYDATMSDEQKQFILRKLEDNYNLLEQRQSDLKSVELVSLQMLPTISMMMKANHQLMCKINTSFIVTLPIFKMGIVMAVMAKRQELQDSAIRQLEDATNEIYEANANKIMQNATSIARSVNSNVIKLETAEKVQGIILNGITEVDRVTKEASEKRKADMARMTTLIDDMKRKDTKNGY